jgi:hypothetical protein
MRWTKSASRCSRRGKNGLGREQGPDGRAKNGAFEGEGGFLRVSSTCVEGHPEWYWSGLERGDRAYRLHTYRRTYNMCVTTDKTRRDVAVLGHAGPRADTGRTRADEGDGRQRDARGRLRDHDGTDLSAQQLPSDRRIDRAREGSRRHTAASTRATSAARGRSWSSRSPKQSGSARKGSTGRDLPL